MREGVRQEIAWGQYVIGNDVQGLNAQMVSDYIVIWVIFAVWTWLRASMTTNQKNQRT